MFLSISLQEPDCHNAKVFPKAAKFHCEAALYSQATEPRERSLLISCSSTPADVPPAVMRQFRHGMSRFWYQAEPSCTALTASSIAGLPVRFGLAEESVAQSVHIIINHSAGPTAVIETCPAEPLLVLARASATLAQDAWIFPENGPFSDGLRRCSRVCPKARVQLEILDFHAIQCNCIRAGKI